jgi:trehalose-6-phosphatase
METYSTPSQIADFVASLEADVTPSRLPLFVLDLDGNALIGYTLAAGAQVPLAPGDDPARRTLPSNADMAALQAQGLVTAGLFAQKPLDARLPATLVERLNHLHASGRPYQLAVLTSRSEADALQVLKDSGVTAPQDVTLIADSGAVMRVEGQRRDIRVLSAQERDFLDGLRTIQPRLETALDELLLRHGLDPSNRPPLEIEQKGIASNLHFRGVIEHYAIAENTPLSREISGLLQKQMQQYIAAASPVAAVGGAAFKLLHGPATLELKLADIDKGHGLHALVNHALQSGYSPSAVVFAGDDVCNRDSQGAAHPGTDYFAFAAAPVIQKHTGIPCHNLHVLHAADGTLQGAEPDASKTIVAMGKPYDKPAKAALSLRSPLELANLVEESLVRCEQKAQAIHTRAERFRSGGASHSR